MQRLWSTEELAEHGTLGAADLALLSGLPDAGKLGPAAQLAYETVQKVGGCPSRPGGSRLSLEVCGNEPVLAR